MNALLLALALIAQDAHVTTLSGHVGDVTQLALSPDGKTLASSGADRVIRLWDLSTGKETAAIRDLAMAPGALAFSPDGKTLAAGLHSQIRLWEIPGAKPLRTIETSFSPVGRLGFGADSKMLLYGTPKSQVEVFDGSDRRPRLTLLTGQSLPEFSADGQWVAIPQPPAPPFKDPATGKVIGTSPIQHVTFWHALMCKELRRLEIPNGPIALSPDGRRIAVVGVMGGRLYNSETGKEEGSLTSGATRPIGAPQFSADGKTICTPLLNSESVVLWDAATLKERATVETPGRRQSRFSVSPHGKALAWAVGQDIKVWRE